MLHRISNFLQNLVFATITFLASILHLVKFPFSYLLKKLFSKDLHLLTTNELDSGKGDYFIRQRRNLFTISLGIIIFELAGGTVTSINTWAANYDFKNAIIIILSAYIGLFYFLFRYWRFAPPLFNNLEVDYYNALHIFDDYNEYLTKKYNELEVNQKASSVVSIGPAHWDDSNKLFLLSIVQVRGVGAHGAFKPHLTENNGNVFVSIDSSKYVRMYLLTWMRVICSSDTFSEVALPYLLFFAAVLTGLVVNSEILICYMKEFYTYMSALFLSLTDISL